MTAPATRAAFAANRAAIAAALPITDRLELRRQEQVAAFRNVARIAGMVNDKTSPENMDRFMLALCYAMGPLELVDQDRVETLEYECANGDDPLFADYRRNYFKREFGL